MGSDWSFGDELLADLPFDPGKPCCHHCGTPAAEGVPGRQARCEACGYHLHTCRNCMFFTGVGCLILSPHMWGESGVMGQECPSFVWRDDTLSEDEITARVRKRWRDTKST